MAQVCGLRVVPFHDTAASRAEVAMRTAAEGHGRAIRRYVEWLATEAMCLQDYERLDMLYIRDDVHSLTGPSVCSTLS